MHGLGIRMVGNRAVDRGPLWKLQPEDRSRHRAPLLARRPSPAPIPSPSRPSPSAPLIARKPPWPAPAPLRSVAACPDKSRWPEEPLRSRQRSPSHSAIADARIRRSSASCLPARKLRLHCRLRNDLAHHPAPRLIDALWRVFAGPAKQIPQIGNVIAADGHGHQLGLRSNRIELRRQRAAPFQDALRRRARTSHIRQNETSLLSKEMSVVVCRTAASNGTVRGAATHAWASREGASHGNIRRTIGRLRLCLPGCGRLGRQ
jgi:hypothetical protein